MIGLLPKKPAIAVKTATRLGLKIRGQVGYLHRHKFQSKHVAHNVFIICIHKITSKLQQTDRKQCLINVGRPT